MQRRARVAGVVASDESVGGVEEASSSCCGRGRRLERCFGGRVRALVASRIGVGADLRLGDIAEAAERGRERGVDVAGGV